MDRFHQFLIDQNYIKPVDLQHALSLQNDSQGEFGRLCLQRKVMTVKQVMEVLKKQSEMKVHFGSLAVICGYLREEQRREIQKLVPPPMSADQALVKAGAISALALRAARAAFEAPAATPAPVVAVSPPDEQSKTVNVADLMALTEDAVAEIRDDLESDLRSLEALLMGNFAADPEGFGRAAFHANRIRGAATVREIPWIPEVAKAIEEFCLQSQAKPPKDGAKLGDLLFRGTDAIRSFVESLGSEKVQVNHAWFEQLKTHLHRGGQEEVTQESVNSLLQQEAPAAPAPVAEKALSGKRMMVVDDNKLVRKSLQSIFVSHGADVETAEHGADGVTKIEASKGFDLLVVDIHMPVMDGFGFVEHVRKSERFAKTPIVMFTASLSMDDVRRARDLQVEGYLLKNAPKEELLGKVAAILAKK